MAAQQKDTMQIQQAVTKVQRILLDAWNKESPTIKPGMKRQVRIYLWEGRGHGVGVRVAEVSFTTRPIDGTLCGTSGSSFMQSDEESVCFLTERLILDILHHSDDMDWTQQRLIEAAFKP